MGEWIVACLADAIEAEDVMRFDHSGRTYAIYRDEGGTFFVTDGLCTHEHVHLADGFVMGHIIECPRHQGRFDIRSGKAKSPPACVDLRTYPVKVEAGQVFVRLE